MFCFEHITSLYINDEALGLQTRWDAHICIHANTRGSRRQTKCPTSPTSRDQNNRGCDGTTVQTRERFARVSAPRSPSADWVGLCSCAVNHLLNIVDPVHWIVYFLPPWWKFWNIIKEENRENQKVVKLLQAMHWVTGSKASGDLLHLHCLSLPVNLQGESDTTALQGVCLSPSHCWHFHTSDKNRAGRPWAEMDGWMKGLTKRYKVGKRWSERVI